MIALGRSASAAPLLHAQGRREQARWLLAELDQMAANRADPVYASVLTGLVRAAVALNDPGPTLAVSLTAWAFRLRRLCRSTPSLAATRTSPKQPATRRRRRGCMRTPPTAGFEFGNKPECAYALLGQGRSLTTLGKHDEAQTPLREARELLRLDGLPACARRNTITARPAGKCAAS